MWQPDVRPAAIRDCARDTATLLALSRHTVLLPSLPGGQLALAQGDLSAAVLHDQVPPPPGRITDPAVVRTLSCPADAPFYALRLALQTAFGWSTTHSFDFAVTDPAYQRRQT